MRQGIRPVRRPRRRHELAFSGTRRAALVGPTAPARPRCCACRRAPAPPTGHVTLAPSDRIGYLPQEPPRLRASLEVVEAALREYRGAIVAVSHDRAFLDAIGIERRLRVGDGTVVER